MADFPENEIEILDDYVSDDFIKGMTEGFSNDFLAPTKSLENIIPEAKRDELKRISLARKNLLRFFNHPVFTNSRDGLRAVMDEMAKGNFLGAETQLNDLVKLASVTIAFDFVNALNSSPVNFTVVEIRETENPIPGKPPIEIETKEPGTLPAYDGPRPSDAPGQRLVAWSSFLSKGPEHRFRIDLLQAEINVGLRKFGEAISLFDGLLTMTPSGSPPHKFVAIRSAFAHLARGDQLFRKQRAQTDEDRQIITDFYDAAVRLLQEKGVSPDNPLRQQVEAHAGLQKAKLQSRLNFLELSDAFVPVQRFSALEGAAGGQIQDAKDSIEKFSNFLKQGEEEQEKEMGLEFQKREEDLNLGVLAKKQANATLGIDKIAEQLSAIDDQEEFLAAELLVDWFGASVGGAAKGGGFGFVLGNVGTMINFMAQSEELVHQRRIGEIEKAIGENEAAIARIERKLSEHRIAFYNQKLDFLANKRLNKDLLYALAVLNEKRAERQLEVAIYLAYLYERALAFFLGEPDIRRIQFDYLDRPLGIFDAANALDEDFKLLVQVEKNKLTPEKVGFFNEAVSLRESYPIQFSRFLQTGEMDFVYSLYQLSKRRPATHQCRLRDVGMEVVGLLPPTGFSGTLTHNGHFLVRDRVATLDPGVTRLVPTDEQLAQALEEQRQQGLPVAAVGGVLCYNLDPDSTELSLATQFVSPVPTEGFTLNLFEGHGPTGLWKLEIREHGKLAISDILLHFAIVSRESDPFLLEPKVEALVRAYEADLAEGDSLDQISAFSVRQNFPNTFFTLQTGPAGLTLAEENFQDGLTNLQFKMVIAQALDQEGKGVPGIALEISRPEFAFNQARVTLTDGFSEDLDAPPQMLPRDQRFPVIGAWQIRLSNPAQFAQLGDLRLFFLYAFEEV